MYIITIKHHFRIFFSLIDVIKLNINAIKLFLVTTLHEFSSIVLKWKTTHITFFPGEKAICQGIFKSSIKMNFQEKHF